MSKRNIYTATVQRDDRAKLRAANAALAESDDIEVVDSYEPNATQVAVTIATHLGTERRVQGLYFGAADFEIVEVEAGSRGDKFVWRPDGLET